eukprot:3994746-Pyramimonas_sp.AAC.1
MLLGRIKLVNPVDDFDADDDIPPPLRFDMGERVDVAKLERVLRWGEYITCRSFSRCTAQFLVLWVGSVSSLCSVVHFISTSRDARQPSLVGSAAASAFKHCVGQPACAAPTRNTKLKRMMLYRHRHQTVTGI